MHKSLYRAQVLIAPTMPVLSLQELKTHCNIDSSDTDHDALLTEFGEVAREECEFLTGRGNYLTTYQKVWDLFPDDDGKPLHLSKATPLVSVVSVQYTNSSGEVSIWDPSLYIVNADAEPGHILPAYGTYYPVYIPYPSGSVRVTYVAGLDPNASPLIEPKHTMKQAIKILVGSLWENREDEIIPDRNIQVVTIPHAAKMILQRIAVEGSPLLTI